MGSSGPQDNHFSANPNLISADKDYILSYVRNHSAATGYASLWINNVAFINKQSALIGAFNSTDLEICLGRLSATNSARPLNGLISEVIIFNRSLKQSEIDEVESYLSKKYNIKLS